MKSKKENGLPEIKSKHELLKNFMLNEEILFMNESRATFILTNNRLLVHASNTNKSGGRKSDGIFRREYTFPIHKISSIHKTGTVFISLTIDASGTTYSFPFAPGKNQFGKKNNMGRKEIIQHIASLVSQVQTTPTKQNMRHLHPEDSSSSKQITQITEPFYCQVCESQRPSTKARLKCGDCSRYVCIDCFTQMAQVGKMGCPMCEGNLVTER